jgi:hypothetical protein
MPFTVEYVDFLSIVLGVDHAVFREVIGWAFPLKRISRQAVLVLLLK